MSSSSILSLNWFDFAIMGIILLSIIISLFRGFLREAISLITWIVAVMVALKFSPWVAVKLSGHVTSVSLRYVIAFAGLFFVIIIIGAIVNSIIRLLVNTIGIGFADRILGAVFGLARGILVIAIVLMLFNMTALRDETWLTTSAIAPQFNPIIAKLNVYLPDQVKNVSEWMSDSIKNISSEYEKVTPDVRNRGNDNQNPS